MGVESAGSGFTQIRTFCAVGSNFTTLWPIWINMSTPRVYTWHPKVL